MRFFHDFPTALNEIKRDLAEMGIKIHTKSVQNLDITNNPDYDCMELQDYSYRVTSPDFTQIPLRNSEWAEQEFNERTSGFALNPGTAWKFRADYWKQFLNAEGKFDYAYPERMTRNLDNVIDALRKDPSTRRAYLSILGNQDPPNDFTVRYPCSIGYSFLYRQGQLNITYKMRSSDFMEHFNYDIYLADRLKHYVAEKTGLKPGFFTHEISSLHAFQKDLKGVF